MRFIATSTLFANAVLFSPVLAQPEPEMEAKWEAVAVPKIQAELNKQLHRFHAKSSAKTKLIARGYLEKNGTVNHLRIDKPEEETDLSKADTRKLEIALLAAIKNSTPLPYGNRPDSLLKHVGLYVRLHGSKVEAGMTHPEDYPGP